MLIQLEKMFLFETGLQDPFFMGTKDGVSVVMANPRSISNINIENVEFYVNSYGKSGLTYKMLYGGEDSEVQESYGKSKQEYKIEFDTTVRSQKSLEKLAGKQFSLLGMRRDLSYFVIFAQLEIEPFEIDNQEKQRVTFKSRPTGARIFDVNSFTLANIGDELPDFSGVDGGFDYVLDFAFE